MNIIKNKIRIFLWLVLALAVIFLLYKGIVPGGRITYVYDFSGDNSFIGKLSPNDRVENIENRTQKIIGNPVYFSLHTPRRFNEAKLEIKYKKSDNIEVIEAGVLMDKTIWNYKLEPVENKIIDRVGLVWESIQEGDRVLLQRDKKFESIGEFFNNMPPRNEIAVYNTELKDEFLLDDYETFTEFNSVSAIRGTYQFYTYLKAEDLEFDFEFFSLESNNDIDSVEVNLYYMDNLIDSVSADDIENKTQEVKLRSASLPEGVYKIEVKANNDLITKSIRTKQSKLSFINKIWLYNEGKEDIKLYSDLRRLNVQTVNPGSLQTIRFGDYEINLDETYKQFSSKLHYSTSTEVFLEKDGVILAGEGVISFNKNALINPAFKKVTADLEVNKENINYILADYITPEKNDDGWKIAKIKIDLNNAYREFYKYGFMIAVPGLRADDNINDFIEIDSIEIELKGTNLMDYIKKIF